MWRDGTEFRWSNKEAAGATFLFDFNKFPFHTAGC
jgi:hypothetical protein